jgi:hypothetical protein
MLGVGNRCRGVEEGRQMGSRWLRVDIWAIDVSLRGPVEVETHRSIYEAQENHSEGHKHLCIWRRSRNGLVMSPLDQAWDRRIKKCFIGQSMVKHEMIAILREKSQRTQMQCEPA